MIVDGALASIERLHKMKTDGIISEADFEKAKSEILEGRIKPTRGRTEKPTVPLGLPTDDDYLAWMLLPFKRYADFSGRSTRKEFWMFMLLTNAVTFVLLVVMLSDQGVFGGLGTVGILAVALLFIGVVGTVVPFLAVEARRFHDQGKSGWFVLLNLIPYVGFLIVYALMLIPGNEGDNDFGPNPLA